MIKRKVADIGAQCCERVAAVLFASPHLDQLSLPTEETLGRVPTVAKCSIGAVWFF